MRIPADRLVLIHAEGIAERGTSPFENPATVNLGRQVLARRGEVWAQQVLGRTFDRRSLINRSVPWLEPGDMEILVMADREDTEPGA